MFTEPQPATPQTTPQQPRKREAKNDMLAWGAFILGWLWPLGLILGHSSNRSAKRANRRRSILSIIGLCEAYVALAITAIAIIAGVATSGDQPKYATGPATSSPAATAPATPTTEPTKSQDQPTISVSKQQALASAQSYLDMGNGFSRAGLIRQLKFEKFSTADATWAADHSGANWDEQAVLSARSYIKLGTGFSRGSLIQQLTSPYGEQFTLAQATYAANHVGL